jgi:hypothetical protein
MHTRAAPANSTPVRMATQNEHAARAHRISKRRAACLVFALPRRMHNGMALRTVSHQASLQLSLCVCVLLNASMPVEIGLDAKVTYMPQQVSAHPPLEGR